MKDLLDEEEFIKKDDYNPWKVFYGFYVAAILQLLLFIFIIGFFAEEIDAITVGAIAIFLPVITAFAMFFWKKQNADLPLKTLAFSIFLLLCAYYLPIAVMAVFIGGAGIEELGIMAALFMGDFFFSSVIIVIIAHFIQKCRSRMIRP